MQRNAVVATLVRMNEFPDDTIYLLDSYGLIYRAYFAFVSRPLRNSKGENISAIFGFFKNLAAVFSRYPVKTIIAAFDSKTPTFRHKIFPEYKATRHKTPDDLHAQIPEIEKLLMTLGIPVAECDGFEADDVIATLSTRANALQKKCRILSGDKDLLQLVNSQTQILKPESHAIWKAVDENGVKAEWGVFPNQMLDLLSLTGDASDNVPGVKGCGIKTAYKLLSQYETLDGIYEHANEIKGAVGEKIRNGKAEAYFSKRLIRLEEKVPGFENFLFTETKFHFAKTAEALFSLEMPNIAKSFAALAEIDTANSNAAHAEKQKTSVKNGTPKTDENESSDLKQNKGNYKAVTDQNEFDALIDEIIKAKKPCALDTETTSLNTLTTALVGFSLCNKPGTGFYIPVSFFDKSKILESLSRLFLSKNLTLVMHNGKFDYQVLRSNGMPHIDEYHAPLCKIADTMVASWLLESNKTETKSYALEYLSEKFLHIKGIEYDEIVPKDKNFSSVPLEKAVDYCAEDSDFTLRLWIFFEAELKKNDLLALFWEIEMPLLPILSEMEIAGIHVSTHSLSAYNKELSEEIKDIEKSIFKITGKEFNIASTKQLQEILFDEMKLPHGKKTKTGYSTDTGVLEGLAENHPIAKHILSYREKTKLQSTYAASLPKLCDKNGRIHTHFIQTGTATGRLSSRDPNLQNIPVRNEDGRRIRTAFTADKNNVLISADYSQIELVVLAHLSDDENMKASFLQGKDIHRTTASLLFSVDEKNVSPDERRIAKTINFGIIYGMSAFRLARDIGISRTQASLFINDYFQKYAAIENFIDDAILFAEEHGFVKTLFGRKRRIVNIHSKNKIEKAAADRVAVNTIVQGSAADIVKKAMLAVSKLLSEKQNGVRLLLQVHDELIFECPEPLAEETALLIKEKMENAVSLSVPLRVSVESGKNWGAFH